MGASSYMTHPLFTPTETSKRLGIQTSRLRKYVAYFPGLFSESARRDRDRQYSEADIEVFRRVREFGGKISLLPTVSSGEAPAGAARPDAASITVDSLAAQLQALQELVYTLVHRQIEIDERQAALLERLDRIATSFEKEVAGPLEYRRRPSASTWHWNRSCLQYPKRGQYVVTTSRPSTRQLCSGCARKESEA